MLKSFTLLLIIALSVTGNDAMANPEDSTQTAYNAALKATGKTFISYFRPGYVQIYSLPEKTFLYKMDSARIVFLQLLNKYRSRLSGKFIHQQELEINYYFNRLLAEYPYNYEMYTGKTLTTSLIMQRLRKCLPDFNKPEYLQNSDFTDYARAFFAALLRTELQKKRYRYTDNRNLTAIWQLLPQYITNKACIDFWQFDYLYSHIDNNGIKNIGAIYHHFKTTCSDTAYLRKVTELYRTDSAGRQGHLTRIYKQAGPYKLDIHIFSSASKTDSAAKPVIVFFHGGSWSEGKPDWFFYNCYNYAQKGWVACTVEYRIYGRHGTLPFEAVKDARSAIRWLRQHALELNIDTNRIVVSGNSAGGHLALTCAMASSWNEATDNLHYSPVPNLMMINSGVYDLTDQNTAWIRKDLKDKDLVKTISPDYLVQPGLPPVLVIHGTSDSNVPYSSALLFEQQMIKAGNNITFHPIKGATHFIWFDPQTVDEVNNTRIQFLQKWGY